MKNYNMLDLYCGHAEDTSLSSLRVAWMRKTKFKNAKELLVRFIADFVDAARALYPKKEPLSEATLKELDEKGYEDPSDADDDPLLADIFKHFSQATIDGGVYLAERLEQRGWSIGTYRNGTATIVNNFDGYLGWMDNGHDEKDIPSWCAQIMKSYDIKL